MRTLKNSLHKSREPEASGRRLKTMSTSSMSRSFSSKLRLLAAMFSVLLLATACSADSGSDVADTATSDSGSSSDGESEFAGDAAGDAAPAELAADDAAESPELAMEEEAMSDESVADSEEDFADAPADEAPALSTTVQPRPAPGLLTAGDIDDNLNNDFFVNWLGSQQLDVSLTSRIEVFVEDNRGNGLGNIPITVESDQRTVTIVTDTAGHAWFYPGYYGFDTTESEFTFSVSDVSAAAATGDSSLTLAVDEQNELPSALDIAIVLDTTGSMADELAFLTRELEEIIADVEVDFPDREIRVALIVYRDTGQEEEYVTRVFDFDSVGSIQDALADQRANGGGDFPEAMDAALEDAAGELSWSSGNDVARMLILNADAPPHEGDIEATFEAGRELSELGVRIYPLAASGVDFQAEAVMRTLAATTGGRHLFLTSDSGIGGAKLEPKVECYHVTSLRDLLTRVIATEFAGERIEANPASLIRTVGQPDSGVCL